MTAGGFSPKRLARVRHVLERHVDVGYVPGTVAVVARRGAAGRRYPPRRAGALAAVGDADD